eukprot:897696-Rhodomonas_salina.1
MFVVFGGDVAVDGGDAAGHLSELLRAKVSQPAAHLLTYPYTLPTFICSYLRNKSSPFQTLTREHIWYQEGSQFTHFKVARNRLGDVVPPFSSYPFALRCPALTQVKLVPGRRSS